MPARPLLTPGAAQRYVDAFLNTRGVVALWPLWEAGGMGTKYVDLGPNHFDATTAGTVSPSRMPGTAADAALLGNGTSGYLSVPYNSKLDLDALTVTAIVFPGATGAARSILSKLKTGFYLRLDTANKLNFLKSNTTDMVHSTVAVGNDKPHFVAGGKVTGSSTVKLYIDGADVTSTVTSATMAGTSSELRIGADINGPGNPADFFNGRLAMVGLHNRLLSQTEVYFLTAAAFGS